MGYALLFTAEAVETFDAISTQILERWGETVWSEFNDKVSKSLDTISNSPLIYPIVSENILDVRKCIFHKNCSIIYKITDKTTIHIICFWDNRQEPIFR